jgi:NAD-dependent DNA ligase
MTLPANSDPNSLRIQQLRDELHAHNHRYYVEDKPSISDEEFDRLLKELEALESAHPEWTDPNSPTLRVGGAVTKKFASVAHKVPMQSLASAERMTGLPRGWFWRDRASSPRPSRKRRSLPP